MARSRGKKSLYGKGSRLPKSWRKANRRQKSLSRKTGKAVQLQLKEGISMYTSPDFLEVREGEKGIDFLGLPMAKGFDGHCPKCDYYPNPKRTKLTIHHDRQEVHKCGRCGIYMRPKKVLRTPSYRRWGW